MTSDKNEKKNKIMKRIDIAVVTFAVIAIVIDLFLNFKGEKINLYKYAIAGLALAYVLQSISNKQEEIVTGNAKERRDSIIELVAKSIIAFLIAIGNFLI